MENRKKNALLIFDDSSVIYDDINILREEIKQKHNLLNIPDTIKLAGKELSVQAYQQIKNRDPKNSHVLEMKKEIVLTVSKLIEQSDFVIIYNKIKNIQGTFFGTINSELLIYLTIAWYIQKPVYLFFPPDRSSYFFEEMTSFDCKIWDKELEIIFKEDNGEIQEALRLKDKEILADLMDKPKKKLKLKRTT